MSTSTEKTLTKPVKLAYEDILNDLCSIPLNQKDVLFEKDNQMNELKSNDNELYEKIEKYVLFNSNLDLEGQNIDSDLSIGKLDKEFEKVEHRLQNLQNFIDISEKFLSLSNKQN